MRDHRTEAARGDACGFITLVAVCGVISMLTGCSGMEIGTKAWISRVDERQESQKTHRQAVPLKCYFTNCNAPAEEAQGS